MNPNHDSLGRFAARGFSAVAGRIAPTKALRSSIRRAKPVGAAGRAGPVGAKAKARRQVLDARLQLTGAVAATVLTSAGLAAGDAALGAFAVNRASVRAAEQANAWKTANGRYRNRNAARVTGLPRAPVKRGVYKISSL